MHNNASLNVQLLQKETLETFSKSLPSSNNLETLAEQLADQLSGLDPQRWFQGFPFATIVHLRKYYYAYLANEI